MTDRSPNHNFPPPSPSSSSSSSESSPSSLRRLSQTLTLSLYKSTAILSLKLFPFLKSAISRTLGFFSMDSLWFNDDDNDFLFDSDSTNRRQRQAEPDDEQLYFVRYRWWNEARESLFGDSAEIKGVLYSVSSSGSGTASMEVGAFDDECEIILNLRRNDDADKCGSAEAVGSDEQYALISEWMFLRALKWHNDLNDVGSILATQSNKQDLFSLHIRLSVLWETSSLVLKISQKDNQSAAFNNSWKIFCSESGLLNLWDFSGQTTQFLANDRIKLSSDLGQPKEEVRVELQVYGLSNSIKAREGRENGLTARQFVDEGPQTSGSLKLNGSTNYVNSFGRVKGPLQPGGSNMVACTMGLTGLYNLGNTCFMNSAIQCLVHTSKLVDYFLGDYRKDINTENPLGLNGELALAFGDLLRKLWTPGSAPVSPRVFKLKLADFAPQFSGYNQHDSQEFLAFLLDGLHEDLNRVKCKPYIEVKDDEGRPDEEVADEHWRNHLARNNSIIVDVCQGQYRSTLVCPICKKKSVTFDPFMYLSLPLPSTTMRTMTLTMLSTDGSSLPYPVTVNVPKFGRCKDLVHALSAACHLREDETLLVAEIYNNHILHFLDKPSDSIELIRDADRLVAYRLPKDRETSPLVVFRHQHVDKSHSRATSPKMFGTPLAVRMSDLSRGSEIRKEFLKLLNPFVFPVEDSLDDYSDAQNTGDDVAMDDAISSVLSDGDANSDSESRDDASVGLDFEFELNESGGLHSSGTKILMNEPVPISGSPRVVDVLVSWPDKMIELYDTCVLSSLPVICNSGLSPKSQEAISLYNCLEAFLKEEPLGPEDMWYCPDCKKHRQASKKLDLWRLPEILVIHLKRFSYSRFLKRKLETFVDFPIDVFDLSTYIASKGDLASHRYMLYAISNHYGGLGGGHYTAFVQHGRGRWFEFDDSHVQPVSDDEIKTSAAYVLFYRRISDV